MVLHRTLKVAVAAVVTLVSIIPTAVAEEIAQAAHIEDGDCRVLLLCGRRLRLFLDGVWRRYLVASI